MRSSRTLLGAASLLVLVGCWETTKRTPPPDLTGRYLDAAIVTRPMPGYDLWLKRDFLFTATTVDGVVSFFGDPGGRQPTLGARVAGTYELGEPTAPGEYPARLHLTLVHLIPRAPYMVTLLASGPCGLGGWELDQPGDVLGTGGCQPLGFTVPVIDHVRVVGRELIIGTEPPLVRSSP